MQMINTCHQQIQATAIALYAFSADPITYGHINIVQRISRQFDKVIVGIGQNPTKSYLFNLDERLALAKQALAPFSNVQVITFRGMLVDFAKEQGAKVIIKGVRNSTDFEYEHTLHQVGISQQIGIDTHILFTDPALTHISSSVVKAIQIEHGFTHEYVPLAVKAALEVRLGQQTIIGVTGEIAVGKSTLCNTLCSTGNNQGIEIHHIDLDKLAHTMLTDKQTPSHHYTCQQIISLFGNDIVEQGNIDRKKLAVKAFHSKNNLTALNKIMEEPIKILLRKALYGKKGIVLLNAALLAESGMLSLCNNRVILISAPTKIQQQRLYQRGMDNKQIERRLASQFNTFKKRQSIEVAIEKHHFGHLWVYPYTTNNTDRLLDQIITLTKNKHPSNV